MSNINLPNIFPEEVIVEDEKHEFKGYKQDDGGYSYDTEYSLNKAPIKYINEVTGQVNGKPHTFVKGEDYKLSEDNNRIVWLDGTKPDRNTVFSVEYRSRSILDRYTESGEEELDKVEEALQDAIESKQIDNASGDDLDRIGSIFGPIVGKRRERDDPEYRAYLKSVVKSFISRGTKGAIKTVVQSALEIDPDRITINEDFDTTSYTVEIDDWTEGQGINGVDPILVNDLVEVADPSGVNLDYVSYIFPIIEATEASTDEINSNIEEPRLAVSDGATNFDSTPEPDSRNNIDFNSVFKSVLSKVDEGQIQTEDVHVRSEKVEVVGWNEDGKAQIDVSDDDETSVSSTINPEDEQIEELAATHSKFIAFDEVRVTLAGVGRGNIDVADDGTSVDWEPEDLGTYEDSIPTDDSSNETIDQLSPAYINDGKQNIDLYQLKGSVLDATELDTFINDDSVFTQVDELEPALAGVGDANIDFSDDGTAVDWEPEDLGEYRDGIDLQDDSNETFLEMGTAYFNEGEYEVDVFNLVEESLTELQESTFAASDRNTYNVQEIEPALAGIGRGNIDFSDDGTTVSWQPEDLGTEEDSSITDDSQNATIDELSVAHINTGKHAIDVFNELENEFSVQETNIQSIDEEVTQELEPVLTASVSSGDVHVDVTYDGSTTVSGSNTEDLGTEEDTKTTYEKLVENFNSVSVSTWDQGISNIDVYNDGVTIERWNDSTLFNTSDSSGFDESANEQFEQIQAAYANEGRVQIDASDS